MGRDAIIAIIKLCFPIKPLINCAFALNQTKTCAKMKSPHPVSKSPVLICNSNIFNIILRLNETNSRYKKKQPLGRPFVRMRVHYYHLFLTYARACKRAVSIPNALFSNRLLNSKKNVAILNDILDNFL